MIRKILIFAIASVVPMFGSVLFTLDSPTLAGAPGDELIYQGTLISDSDVFVNGICITFSTPCDNTTSPSPSFLSLDTNVFFFNVPGFLDSASSLTYTGPLFGIVIDPSAVPGLYLGNVTLLGGSESDPNGFFDFDPLGSSNFQVLVTPEPESGELIMIALVAYALVCAVSRLGSTPGRV